MAPDAPLVQNPDLRQDDPWRETNIMGQWPFGWGNIETGQAQSALTLTNTYETPIIHHHALEPYAVYALPDNGGIAMYAAIQHPFVLRRVISRMLGLPLAKVRIISTEMGGGFGGRGYPKIEPLVAMLVHKLKQPVKLSLSADEGFHIAQREGARVRIRTGFKPDGKLAFQDVKGRFLWWVPTPIFLPGSFRRPAFWVPVPTGCPTWT